VQAARTLGAGPFDAFCSIMLPLARPGILSGSLLGFARSMGEFGATIMIAGSIPGETRTMSLLIYRNWMHRGAWSNRYDCGGIYNYCATALLAGELLERYGRRRLQGATA